MNSRRSRRWGSGFHGRALVAAPALIGALLVPACGSDKPVMPPAAPAPVIASLSGSVLAPGDTLILAGTNFAASAAANRVVFNNALASAVPYFATSDSLGVVVPAYANSGPMHVTSRGVNSAPRTVEIRRGVGEVWVIGGAPSYQFKLPAAGGTGKYLLIPHSAEVFLGSFGYTLTPDTTSAFPAPPHGRGAPPNLTPAFEHRIRRQAIEYLERRARVRRSAEKVPAFALPPPDTMNFFVLGQKCLTDVPGGCDVRDPATYTTVTAVLRYWGQNALIYSDVDTTSGTFDQSDYDAFGVQFDGQIFGTDTTYFGPPTDVDNNGAVVFVFTPQVNELTPDGTAETEGFISGYTLINDLAFDLFPAGTSNGMEVFFSMVPDPAGERGNMFSKARVGQLMPGTLAHEFEHIISNGYRLIVLGNGTTHAYLQETWLEEGMAHMAEDLNAMFAENESRANRYLRDPGAVSLMGNDTLEQRGGIFLFLRYLGDQLGTGIYRSILQTRFVGRPCVEAVTGRDFFASVADYLATLYLSGRGITADPKYRYSSSSVKLDSLTVSARGVAQGALAGSVQNAAGDFYEMTGIEVPATNFKVEVPEEETGSSSGRIRVIVCRIQ